MQGWGLFIREALPSWGRFFLFRSFGLVLCVQTVSMYSFSTNHLNLSGSLSRSIPLHTVVNRKKPRSADRCQRWLLATDRIMDNRMLTSTQSTLSLTCLIVFREPSTISAKVSTDTCSGKSRHIRVYILQLAIQKIIRRILYMWKE